MRTTRRHTSRCSPWTARGIVNRGKGDPTHRRQLPTEGNCRRFCIGTRLKLPLQSRAPQRHFGCLALLPFSSVPAERLAPRLLRDLTYGATAPAPSGRVGSRYEGECHPDKHRWLTDSFFGGKRESLFDIVTRSLQQLSWMHRTTVTPAPYEVRMSLLSATKSSAGETDTLPRERLILALQFRQAVRPLAIFQPFRVVVKITSSARAYG
jgi:hypothetical protein